MIDGPASTFGQFGHYIVAVAEKCDVEVDVVGWFARDVDLRHLFVDIVGTIDRSISILRLRKQRKKDLHLGDRGNLHGCANNDDQVDYGGIVLCKSVEEAVGKFLAEEGNVGLQSISMRMFTRMNATYLHHTRLGNIIATIVFRIRMAGS